MAKRLLFLSLVLAFAFPIIAQEDNPQDNGIVKREVNTDLEDESDRCLTVAELIGLVHSPLDSIREFLYDRDFRLGYYSEKDMKYDTVGEVVLHYGIRAAFDHVREKNSVIWIYVSNDGLGNIVDVEKTGCDFYYELQKELDFQRDRVNKIFSGSIISTNKSSKYMNSIDGYRILYEDDEESTSLNLIIRDTTEITNYINAEKAARWQRVQGLVGQAVDSANNHHYISALNILDTLIGNGVLEAIVTGTRNRLVDEAEQHYFTLLNRTVNTLMRPDYGIHICDTLIMFCKNKDSVSAIREMLVAQVAGETAQYSNVCPDEFAKVVGQLEDIINLEIKKRSTSNTYRIKFDFTIATDTGNSSFGNIKLIQGLTTLPETNDLQSRIDNIAQSTSIHPIYDNGVYVVTRQELSADIKWRYRYEKIIDTCEKGKEWLKPYVEKVENEYFRVGQRPSLPTKRIYKFGIKEKDNLGQEYTDIELVSFKYPGAFSWMPSLVVPGLGTKLQGASSSVAGRLIPFLLSSALAVGGFVYEDYSASHNLQRVSLTDEFDHIYQIKNIGYIVGTIGGVLAVSVYIDELVDGISTSVNNRRRASRLRKDLSAGPVILQSEKIRL